MTEQELRAAGATKVATGVLRTADGKFFISDQRGGFSEVDQAAAQRYAEGRVSDGFLGMNDAKDVAGVRETFAQFDVEEAEKDPTKYENQRPESADVYADPYAIDAQRRALDEISQYGQGGLRPEDEQAIQKGQMMQGQYLRGQREAALDQAEMRGMRGGAAQLASDIGAQQGMAQALFMQNADINNAASDRALRALGMQEGAGQGMRRDSFSEGGFRANAVDNWRQGEVNYARQQRAAAHANLEARRQQTAATPGGAEEFMTTAGPVIDLGAQIGMAAAGLPPVDPGVSEMGNGAAQNRAKISSNFQAPAAPGAQQGGAKSVYSNPYSTDNEDEFENKA
jgi:hypothetical protein